MMEFTIDISNDRVIELAHQFLCGNWLKLTANDIKLTILSGGVCSRIYIVDNISETVQCDFNRFLVRLFGGRGMLEEMAERGANLVTLDSASQVLLMHEFGKQGDGPKLLGSFEGGRIEEFVPSRTLSDDDLRDVQTRKEIARKLARYHNVRLPLCKKPLDHIDIATVFYTEFEEAESQEIFARACALADLDPKFVLDMDWRAELKWLRETGDKIKTRYVLCNNDLNKNNALVRDTPDKHGERIMLIDYELSSFNPRGLDIGHHFIHWLFTPDLKTMDFLSKQLDYPDENIRRAFVEEYLKETKMLVDYEFEDIDSVDHVMMETDFFQMRVLHFWISNFVNPKKTGVLANDMIRAKIVPLAKRFIELYFDRKAYYVCKYQT